MKCDTILKIIFFVLDLLPIATEDKETDLGGEIDIEVNDATYKHQYTDCGMAIYTLSIDDNTVLLALCEKGRGYSSETDFFQYKDGQVEFAGEIFSDVRYINDKENNDEVTIEKGVIKWTEDIAITDVKPIVESKWDGQYLYRECEGELDVKCTQETFYQAMKSIDNFKGNSNLTTWLCAIAKNQLHTYYRKNPQMSEIEDNTVSKDTLEDQIISDIGKIDLLKKKVINIMNTF